MAVTPGDFTATELRNVKVKLADIFAVDSMANNLNRDVPIFNGLAQVQQVRFQDDVRASLMDAGTCNAVEATFLVACDLPVVDCTDSCEIPRGIEMATDKVVFQKNMCFEVHGLVKSFDCKNEIEAKELEQTEIARMISALDQKLESTYLARLISWSDDLSDLDRPEESMEIPVGGLDSNKTIWEVPPSDWNTELIAHLEAVIEDCQMVDPKIVQGKAWQHIRRMADAKDKCCGSSCSDNCHAYDSLLGSIDMITNLREFDKALGAKGMLLVDAAKIGYFNSWENKSPTPVNIKDEYNTHLYYMNSQKAKWKDGNSIVPVKYDFYRQTRCNNLGRYEVRLLAKHRGGTVTYPDGCPGVPNKKVIQIHKKECAGC